MTAGVLGCDLLGPVRDLRERISCEDTRLKFLAPGRKSLQFEQLCQGCRKFAGIDLAVRESLPKAQLDNPVCIVGLVVRTRDDKVRHARGDAFCGGSYPPVMYDGSAPREEVLEACVLNMEDVA